MKDKNLIICDIDGTLANVQHRLHYIKNPDGSKKPYKERDWDSFHKACVDDTLYKDVREILWNIYDAGRRREFSDRIVYFFSGRSEVVRKETEEWLREHVVSPSMCEYGEKPNLYMRKEGDIRNDIEVKREMIKTLKIHKWNSTGPHFPPEHITPDDVLCILDDRQGVVDMWRQEGFRCLQVDAWEEPRTRTSELGGGKSAGVNQPTVPTPPTLETPDKNLSEIKENDNG